MQQHKVVLTGTGREDKIWQVDISALEKVSGHEWLTRFPQLIETDLREMGEFFRHWILVAGKDERPLACTEDQEYIVPKDGKMRCLKCDRPYGGSIDSLVWTGMLPVNVAGASKVLRNIKRLEDLGELKLIHVANQLLVPIRIAYPRQWPHSDPSAYYTREFFETLGVPAPSTSHEHHMNGGLRMCLFASWHEMTILEVIQNRIGPHALAQVMIACGERPKNWFNR